MHFLDPFLIYTPSEEGMTTSEVKDTGTQAGDFNKAAEDFLLGQASEDDVNDRLREMHIEPVDYWDSVVESIEVLEAQGLGSLEFDTLPSGLIVPR